MNSDDPFTPEKLNEIFKLSLTHSDRVNSRESQRLEFKESFWDKSLPKYLKTCAAFANNKGGYIVFGIKNKPHLLLGLQGKSLSEFNALDPERLTNYFNDYFSPEIVWVQDTYTVEGKQFGIFFIHESKNKPVMCRKMGEVVKEGEIYYRYSGRSENIKYPITRKTYI